MCEHTPLKISVFSGIKNRNTIPDGAKCTEIAHTDYEDARWSLDLGKQIVKHPKFQFAHKLTMNSRHNLTK